MSWVGLCGPGKWLSGKRSNIWGRCCTGLTHSIFMTCGYFPQLSVVGVDCLSWGSCGVWGLCITEDSSASLPVFLLLLGGCLSHSDLLLTVGWGLERATETQSQWVCLFVSLFWIYIDFSPKRVKAMGAVGLWCSGEVSCVTFVYLAVCDVLIRVAGASPCLCEMSRAVVRSVL